MNNLIKSRTGNRREYNRKNIKSCRLGGPDTCHWVTNDIMWITMFLYGKIKPNKTEQNKTKTEEAEKKLNKSFGLLIQSCFELRGI